jgi:hypothetical protein
MILNQHSEIARQGFEAAQIFNRLHHHDSPG